MVQLGRIEDNYWIAEFKHNITCGSLLQSNKIVADVPPLNSFVYDYVSKHGMGHETSTNEEG